MIRTTPTQSPRSGRHVRDVDQERLPGKYESTEQREDPASDERYPELENRDDKANDVPTSRNIALSAPQSSFQLPAKGKGRETARPPPILKKSKAGSSTQLAKTARIVMPARTSEECTANDDDGAISPATTFPPSSKIDSGDKSRRLSSPPPSTQGVGQDDEGIAQETARTLSLSQSPLERSKKSLGGSAAKSGKRKTTFLASTASNKHRPSITRRKSSQSSSSNASKAASPHVISHGKDHANSPPPLSSLASIRHDIPQMNPSGLSTTSILENTGVYRSSSRAISAKPSEPKMLPSSSPTSPETTGLEATRDEAVKDADDRVRPYQDWLVAKDFRVKFADKARVEPTPFTSVRSIPTKSTTATMAPASFQASGNMAFGDPPSNVFKSKMRQSDFTVETLPLKPPGASGQDQTQPSVLPRSKSQLTLLLERDKRSENEKKVKRGASSGKK